MISEDVGLLCRGHSGYILGLSAYIRPLQWWFAGFKVQHTGSASQVLQGDKMDLLVFDSQERGAFEPRPPSGDHDYTASGASLGPSGFSRDWTQSVVSGLWSGHRPF